MQYPTTPSISPIPARVAPQPWEDLASYISRLAMEMGYENPGWLLHPEGVVSSVQPFNLCLLRRQTDYHFFEQLLYLSEETLYGLTLHRFAQSMLEPELSHQNVCGEVQRPLLLSRYVFQTFFHPYSATKVCSKCLEQKPAYSRLYWSVLPVVACLHHNIFLTDLCPVCSRPIPLLRPSIARCPRCKQGDYREALAIPLSAGESFRGGMALLLDHLGIESIPLEDNAARKCPPPLIGLLPWQYFRLLDACRCILGPLLPDAPFIQSDAKVDARLRSHPRHHSALTSLEWSVVISTFHWLFTDWPDNFFSFLDSFPRTKSSRARKRDRERTAGVQRDFGLLYEKWLYKRLAHPAFSFLREAFEEYLRVRYTTGEVTRRLLPFKWTSQEQLQERPYMTKVQTRARLGIGEDVLQSLLRQGVLRATKMQGKKRSIFLIEKASVEALRQAWRELVPLEDVARSYLGVSKGVVIALEDAGVLLPERGPASDGYKLRLYSRTAIARFEESLLLHAMKVHEEATEASYSLPVFASKAGLPLIILLEEILGGHLAPIEADGDQLVFQRLMLPKEEIRSFLKDYKRRQREEQELLLPQEVAVELGISRRVLERWARLGLIEGERLSIAGKKPSLLFRKQALEDFYRSYIFTKEAAELLDIIPQTISKYVSRGRLHPLAGRRTDEGGNRSVFRRTEVTSLASSSRRQ